MSTLQNANSLLTTNNLQVGYRLTDGKVNALLDDLNLAISGGELITFIGPNGSGKSTLIKTLAGLLPALHGNIFLSGTDCREITSAERSELMGVVLTDPVYERNMTVYDIVALGRYQYTNWLGRLNPNDREIVHRSIQQVDLSKKMHSRLNELSDGERQRAMIAKVLAQDVKLIILDEPTAHLDLPNRMEMLLLLKQISHTSGKGILLSTHELSLALQISDKIWLLNRENKLVQSLPEELILSGQLDKTFGTDHIGFHPFSASFELVPDKKHKAYITGDGLVTACVIRLLKRLRIGLVQEPLSDCIIINVNELSREIDVNYAGKNIFFSIAELQNYLTRIIDEA